MFSHICRISHHAELRKKPSLHCVLSLRVSTIGPTSNIAEHSAISFTLPEPMGTCFQILPLSSKRVPLGVLAFVLGEIFSSLHLQLSSPRFASLTSSMTCAEPSIGTTDGQRPLKRSRNAYRESPFVFYTFCHILAMLLRSLALASPHGKGAPRCRDLIELPRGTITRLGICHSLLEAFEKASAIPSC